MTKEFDENTLPEDKRKEILERIALSQEEKKQKRIQQKEAGRKESERRKELIQFSRDKNIQFFEVESLSRGDYTVLCGYLSPSRPSNQKLSPMTTIVYSICCCAPTDRYDENKGKLLIAERIRNGEVTILLYRRNQVPESSEGLRLPLMIDIDLVRSAVTGTGSQGVKLPQDILSSLYE